MQFTDEVIWGPIDFATFGAMLLLAGGAFELAVRMSGSRMYRAGVGVARWSDDHSLDAGLEGVRAYRRSARLSRR